MTDAMHGDGVCPAGYRHGGEEYVITVAVHPDGQVCAVVAAPPGRTPDEAREVLAMVGELSAVADVAVTPSGLMVEVGR